jgi:hypothetical protein
MRGGTAAIAVALAILAAPLAAAQTCDEEVSFEVSDGTIFVYHDQALFNCCCAVEFDVAVAGFEIDITEWEILEGGGCDCLCCFDLAVTIGGLEAGDYVVRVWKESQHGGSELIGTWGVTVDGESAPLLHTAYLPCVSAAVDDATEFEGTWGVIKALYR